MTQEEATRAIAQAGVHLNNAHALMMAIRSGTPTDSVAHKLAQQRVYDIFTVNTQVWYLGAMIEQYGLAETNPPESVILLSRNLT